MKVVCDDQAVVMKVVCADQLRGRWLAPSYLNGQVAVITQQA
jgi:hypothetical protein